MSAAPTLDAAREAIREHGTSPRAQRWGRWLALALFALFLWSPGLELDALQRRTAATTAAVATLWLTQGIPLGAASLLPAALLPLLGVLPAEDAAAPYMDNIVLLFLGAFIVAAGLERWGVHRRMALALVDLVGTQPRRLVLGFTVATAFVSLWINNTAATLMMYPIGLAVISATAREKDARSSPFAIALLLGIAYGASIGGVGTPVGTAPNQILLGTLGKSFPGAPSISFGAWTLAWLPFAALFTLGTWWILTRVALKVGGESLAGGEAIRAERARLGPPSRGEKLMGAVFGLTALLWVTRADLNLGSLTVPGWSNALARGLAVEGADPARIARYVTDATVAVGMGVLCFFVPVDRARNVRLMDWDTVAKTPWDVLLLFGGGFCIAKGFSASGLDAALGRSIAPLLSGLSPVLVVAAIALFMTLLSELTSNTVITQLMLPVLAGVATQSGFHPWVLMVPATIAASSGFMLPVATPPNAIAFSSRLIPMGTMARVGLLVDLLGVVLITLVFHYWVRWLWDIGSGVPAWAQH